MPKCPCAMIPCCCYLDTNLKLPFRPKCPCAMIPCCCYLVAQLCLTLCDPVDCSPPGSSVHGVSQARILEWFAIYFCRGTSRPRDWTRVSCLASRHFTPEPPGKPSTLPYNIHISILNFCNWFSEGGIPAISRLEKTSGSLHVEEFMKAVCVQLFCFE